jgi:hypothetical protein
MCVHTMIAMQEVRFSVRSCDRDSLHHGISASILKHYVPQRGESQRIESIDRIQHLKQFYALDAWRVYFSKLGVHRQLLHGYSRVRPREAVVDWHAC